MEHKCIVHDCQNHMAEGHGKTMLLVDFNGSLKHMWICNPCYFALIEPPSASTDTSQVFRNMVAVMEKKLKKEKVKGTKGLPEYRWDRVKALRDLMQMSIENDDQPDMEKFKYIRGLSSEVKNITGIEWIGEKRVTYIDSILDYVRGVDNWLEENKYDEPA